MRNAAQSNATWLPLFVDGVLFSANWAGELCVCSYKTFSVNEVKFFSFHAFNGSQRCSGIIWETRPKFIMQGHTLHVELLIDFFFYHLNKDRGETRRHERVQRGTVSLERIQQKNVKSRQNEKGAIKYLKARQYVSDIFLLCYFVHPAPVGVGKNCPKYQQRAKEEVQQRGPVTTDSKDVDHLCLIAGRARPPPVN